MPPVSVCHISTVQSVLLETEKLKFSNVLGWARSSFGQSCTGARIDCPASSKFGPTVPKEMCYCPWVHFWRPRVGRTQLHPQLRWETCSKWFWGFVKKQNRKSAWIWSLTIFLTCCSPRVVFFKCWGQEIKYACCCAVRSWKTTALFLQIRQIALSPLHHWT